MAQPPPVMDTHVALGDVLLESPGPASLFGTAPCDTIHEATEGSVPLKRKHSFVVVGIWLGAELSLERAAILRTHDMLDSLFPYDFRKSLCGTRKGRHKNNPINEEKEGFTCFLVLYFLI